MKYVCLGYIQPGKFADMNENERHAMLDECFDYDDKLRANGHFAAGEALQSPEAARTLCWKNGKVVVIDGPYAETKEQVGGILVLEARDLNHAVQLISQHPGVKYGPWEITSGGGSERDDSREQTPPGKGRHSMNFTGRGPVENARSENRSST